MDLTAENAEKAQSTQRKWKYKLARAIHAQHLHRFAIFVPVPARIVQAGVIRTANFKLSKLNFELLFSNKRCNLPDPFFENLGTDNIGLITEHEVPACKSFEGGS
ncbi:MAG: hypothetical protein JWP12_3649 [Bacteroidetes bacterium]|nr:hypothetical protein [Bacteroidota bacterium]